MRTLATPLIVAYAGLLLAWLAARAVWGDRPLLVAVIDNFPTAPFALLPVAGVLALAARQPVAWVALAAVLLVWTTFFGRRFLPRGHRTPAEAPVRVMTFNVLWTNRNWDGLAQALLGSGADVIALPELTQALDDALAALVGDRYPHRLLELLPGAAFGVGIYSRWPLSRVDGPDIGLGLRAALADVRAPGGDFRFIAMHPRATEGTRKSLRALFERMTQSFREREAQIEAMLSRIAAWPEGPVIMAGDFNMSELSDAYRAVAGRLRDAYAGAGWGYGFTWPAGEFNQGALSPIRKLLLLARIDFVFHSDHWLAVAAQAPDAPTGSDHRPVIVDLDRRR